MAFTKQHYKVLGNLINATFYNRINSVEVQDIHSDLIEQLCQYFQEDNPRFKKDVFIKFVNRERC